MEVNEDKETVKEQEHTHFNEEKLEQKGAISAVIMSDLHWVRSCISTVKGRHMWPSQHAARAETMKA